MASNFRLFKNLPPYPTLDLLLSKTPIIYSSLKFQHRCHLSVHFLLAKTNRHCQISQCSGQAIFVQSGCHCHCRISHLRRDRLPPIRRRDHLRPVRPHASSSTVWRNRSVCFCACVFSSSPVVPSIKPISLIKVTLFRKLQSIGACAVHRCFTYILRWNS